MTDSNILVSQGVGYLNQRNYQKAVEYFEEAAEQNNTNAMILLGNMYYNGNGVEINYNKAKVSIHADDGNDRII